MHALLSSEKLIWWLQMFYTYFIFVVRRRFTKWIFKPRRVFGAFSAWFIFSIIVFVIRKYPIVWFSTETWSPPLFLACFILIRHMKLNIQKKISLTVWIPGIFYIFSSYIIICMIINHNLLLLFWIIKIFMNTHILDLLHLHLRHQKKKNKRLCSCRFFVLIYFLCCFLPHPKKNHGVIFQGNPLFSSVFDIF